MNISSQVSCTVPYFLGKVFQVRIFAKCRLRGKTYRINHLPAALRSFYQLLIAIQRYTYPHPLDLPEAKNIISGIRERQLNEFVKLNQRLPMPSNSGVDHWRPLRLASSYYRIKDNEWTPEYLDDPGLMGRVLKAGESGAGACRTQPLLE
ncbi:basic helix-loop-helix domain-containing protein [Citrobacter freundii]|uniref:Uncharacterized protein n=1 Tax=Citrobacter freundii TaxID=546 RepID=A0A9Q9T1V7_CITFR|nr:hypothetical protein [Citrobacter freundii]UYA95098.1 hypothetical protein KKS41_p00495 [Citrobacter freundii]